MSSWQTRHNQWTQWDALAAAVAAPCCQHRDVVAEHRRNANRFICSLWSVPTTPHNRYPRGRGSMCYARGLTKYTGRDIAKHCWHNLGHGCPSLNHWQHMPWNFLLADWQEQRRGQLYWRHGCWRRHCFPLFVKKCRWIYDATLWH